MYSIKPIIDSTVKLEGPLTTMYHMRNIYEQPPNNVASSTDNIETNAVSSLETRQIALLNELHELKQTVRRIAAKQLPTNVATAKPTTAPKRARELPICGKPAPLYIQQRILQIEKNGEGKPILPSTLKDIVINANPDRIPYSLRALKTLWMNRLHLHVQTHAHSSIAQLPVAARKFSDSLQWSDVVDLTGEIPVLNITLIWKPVAHTEVISAATNYIPLIGEVSVLRFLARIGPSEFATTQYPLVDSVLAEAALDVVDLLAKQGDAKKRAQLWQQLSVWLGSNQFFGNELVTLVDVAVSSVAKQQTFNDVPKALVGHLQRVGSVVRYDE